MFCKLMLLTVPMLMLEFKNLYKLFTGMFLNHSDVYIKFQSLCSKVK